MSLAERIRQWDRPVVLYEVIPPEAKDGAAKARRMADRLERVLSGTRIDALNVPEVVNESRNGDRDLNWMEKLDPRAFAKLMQEAAPSADVVVNHPTVHAPAQALSAWTRQTVEDHGIQNIVLVGGESSSRAYPGPGPVAAASVVRDAFGPESVLLGGITIPTRRRAGPQDEPARLMAKQTAGIEFFTTQVIYEAQSVTRLIDDYGAACSAREVRPAPIFLSFAPITRDKDAKFLEWLGVRIPSDVRRRIMRAGRGALQASIDEAESVLDTVLAHRQETGSHVPLGLNVEHVMRYNLSASGVLLERLAERIAHERVTAR